MDEYEGIAEQFLRDLHLSPVQYEPDGNVPPDFVVGSTAVEVRKLNENVTIDGTTLGLESADINLARVLREVAAAQGVAEPGEGKWYFLYRFSRPLADFKRIKREVAAFFQSVRANAKDRDRAHLLDCLEIEVFPGQYDNAARFRPAIVSDQDSGGMLVELWLKNVTHAIREKELKIAPHRKRYPEWWLILIDMIGGGGTDLDWEQFLASSKISRRWDKVLLLDPTGKRVREVPSLP